MLETKCMLKSNNIFINKSDSIFCAYGNNPITGIFKALPPTHSFANAWQHACPHSHENKAY